MVSIETIKSMKDDLKKINQDLDGMGDEYSKILDLLIKKVSENIMGSGLIEKVSWKIDSVGSIITTGSNISLRSTSVPKGLSSLWKQFPNKFTKIILEKNVVITNSSQNQFQLSLYIYPSNIFIRVVKKYNLSVDLSIIESSIKNYENNIKKLSNFKKAMRG